jgi:hypothetical protein
MGDQHVDAWTTSQNTVCKLNYREHGCVVMALNIMFLSIEVAVLNK